MRKMSSRGKADQSTSVLADMYDTQRLRELDEQHLVLQNEYLLLYRTCENIALWNLASVGGFPRYIIVVGFRYVPLEVSGSLEAMRYVYDGHSPKLLLSSYVNSHAEVELHTLERGVPSAPIDLEPLLQELASVRREIVRVNRMRQNLVSYAPGGVGYRKLLRDAAQNKMTRYHFRQRVLKPARYLNY